MVCPQPRDPALCCHQGKPGLCPAGLRGRPWSAHLGRVEPHFSGESVLGAIPAPCAVGRQVGKTQESRVFRATSQASAALAEPATRPHLPPHGASWPGLP